jgi:predicted acylesterase/phospholipase RssA
MRRVGASLSQIRTIRAIGYVLLGRPILSMAPLLAWMNRLLQGTSPHPVRRTIAEISAMRSERPMELLIVSSDLENRGSRKAGPDDDAVSAIADSCAIPFIFRTWRGSGCRFVDGGICSNLPVDFLLDKVRERGEVLAVSFEGQPTQPHS